MVDEGAMSPKPRHLLKGRKHELARFGWQVIGLYTVAWLAFAVLIVAIFLHYGRTFIWDPDGMFQHFAAYNYVCDYAEAFFSGQAMPQFNFTLGQGLDVLTTLGSYDFADPVCWLTALLTPLGRVARYTLMVLGKTYLIGLSFIVFALVTEHKERTPIVLGALAYVFAGSMLYFFARHPNFITWAYYLPFILAGVELYKRKRVPWLLVIAVCFNLITSIYTFYVDMVLAVLYVLVFAIDGIMRERTAKAVWREIKLGLQIAGFCMAGILLASIVFLPMVYGYLNNARVGVATGYLDSALHYPLNYYPNIFAKLFVPYASPGHSTFIGLSAFLIVPLSVLFSAKGEARPLKAIILICIVMACVPFFGSMFNGFGYVSNRWVFAIPLFASVALLEAWPRLKKPSRANLWAVAAAAVVFVALMLLRATGDSRGSMLLAVAVVAGTAAAYLVFARFKPGRIAMVASVLVLLAIPYQIVMTFLPATGDYVSEFCTSKSIKGNEHATSATAAKGLSGGFYRIEEAERNTNRDGFNGTFGTELWWSLIPGNVAEYYIGLGLDTVTQNCNFKGLDARTGLLGLASVKYYTQTAKSKALAPYGFHEVDSPDDKYRVFENDYALPIGYTFDGYILESQLEGLNPLAREQAYLQGAVVEEPVEGLPNVSPQYSGVELSYEIIDSDGAELGDNALKAGKGGGSVLLSADVPENCELYVLLDKPLLVSKETSADITVKREGDTAVNATKGLISNQGNQWYVDRDSIAFNLGCAPSGETQIKISLKDKCEIDFAAFRIVASDMQHTEESLQARRACTFEITEIGNDTIVGSITTDRPRVLQFSIPYSDGWDAELDGGYADSFKSGGMYTAMIVPAGNHEVVLRYRTPYLPEGAIVSTIALITLVALGVLFSIKRKRNSANSKDVLDKGANEDTAAITK